MVGMSPENNKAHDTEIHYTSVLNFA